MPVPLFDTDAPLVPLRETILSTIEKVVRGGRFVLGAEVEAFERELASYLGVAHAVGVANGTDAIAIALRALGVSAGDEVVVPAFTFYATAEAVASIGARPVFCDIELETRNMTADTVRAALTPSTRAVIAVDLCGSPAPVGAIRELGVPVVEDAAQAAGAALEGRQSGSLGDVGTFSFYPSKNLGCFGDGGAVVTDDADLAERVRALRFHGSRDKRTFEYVGYNSRLDELQAAVLRVLLPELDQWCAARRQVASMYAEAGLGALVGLPTALSEAVPAWHLYLVTATAADALVASLAEAGIEARRYYQPPLHHQPAMAPYVPAGLELPMAEEVARTNVALPMSPVLDQAQVAEVVQAVRAAAS